MRTWTAGRQPGVRPAALTHCRGRETICRAVVGREETEKNRTQIRLCSLCRSLILSSGGGSTSRLSGPASKNTSHILPPRGAFFLFFFASQIARRAWQDVQIPAGLASGMSAWRTSVGTRARASIAYLNGRGRRSHRAAPLHFSRRQAGRPGGEQPPFLAPHTPSVQRLRTRPLCALRLRTAAAGVASEWRASCPRTPSRAAQPLSSAAVHPSIQNTGGEGLDRWCSVGLTGPATLSSPLCWNTPRRSVDCPRGRQTTNARREHHEHRHPRADLGCSSLLRAATQQMRGAWVAAGERFPACDGPCSHACGTRKYWD